MAVNLAGVDPRLISYADRNGLKITSARGGKHNTNSKHPRGEAIDFSVRTLRNGKRFPKGYWEHCERDAAAHDLILRDERVRPEGQKVWSAPHGHVETRD